MSAKSKKMPTPDELLAEVHGLPSAKTYAFDDYIEVIDALQKKDHSYADIAAFLKERLGFDATRGQVYRALNIWRADRKAEQLRAEGVEIDDRSERNEWELEAEEFEQRAGESVREWLIEHFPADDFPNPAVSHYGILQEAIRPYREQAEAEKAAAEADEATKSSHEHTK